MSGDGGRLGSGIAGFMFGAERPIPAGRAVAATSAGTISIVASTFGNFRFRLRSRDLRSARSASSVASRCTQPRE